MRSKFWVWTEAIMLLLWIVVTIFFLKAVYSDGASCIANPLVFGANYLSKSNMDILTCSCKFDKQPDFIIQVNKDKWWVEKLGNKPVKLNLNWSVE